MRNPTDNKLQKEHLLKIELNLWKWQAIHVEDLYLKLVFQGQDLVLKGG
jgi:hypothetical protein